MFFRLGRPLAASGHPGPRRLITAFLFLVGLGFLGMAVAFRAGVSRAEKPRFVLDNGARPTDASAVSRTLERWHREGRLSPAERDRLLGLLNEENSAALDI